VTDTNAESDGTHLSVSSQSRKGDLVLYKLWREGKVRVGEVITDKPLAKGDIVQTVWRVVEPAWAVDAGDSTNTRSSGGVLVEPVSPEHMNPRKAI
jgi:hypothetical protein